MKILRKALALENMCQFQLSPLHTPYPHRNLIFLCFFSQNSMPRSSCSAVNGVNPNFKKRLFTNLQYSQKSEYRLEVGPESVNHEKYAKFPNKTGSPKV